ncbi:MAG: glutathione-disulfide reductase [Alphaproteobacteria bacterium]|nr:glutathione-disulfide reductase [Alphaproteobacteria bacterium]
MAEVSSAGFDYDLFVIGAGSGGTRAARIAAGHGARVAVAEERFFGGTCVNIGCVPKKLMVMAADFAHAFEDARGFGWSVGERRHDWASLIANKDREIARLNGIYRDLLKNAGCTVFEARATILDPHTVLVGGERVRARVILVAAGGRPVRPDIEGAGHGIVSDDAFYLKARPRHVLVVGGGYIAVEFAGIFAGLGAAVTQLYRGTLFLRGFDDDIRTHLAEEMRASGIDLRFGSDVTRIEKRADGMLCAHLLGGATIDTDCVFFATGRVPNTAGLGLEAAGVRLDEKGAVIVDADQRSSVPSIYAVGDVTDQLNLTPIALAEGHALADTLFGGRPRRTSHENVATAIFSPPPAATVGFAEAEAAEQFGAVDVYVTRFKPMRHTLSGRARRSMMKLVVDQASQRVVGAHMVGEDAGEIMQGLAIAVNMGASKADFDRTIGIHPTAAEEFVTLRTRTRETRRVAAAAQ